MTGERAEPCGISVIIPVLDDPAGVRDTVESLLAQTHPPEPWEIVVVDNGSSDDTLAVARGYERHHPGRVRVVCEHRTGSYAARNRGIEVASGEILCFIDADMRAPPSFLAELARFLDRHPGVDYVAYGVRVEAEVNTVAATYERLYAFQMRRYFERQHYSGAACLTVRRRLVEQVGAFDARLESGGDREFGQRVHAAGMEQAFLEPLELRHPARIGIASLVAKAMRVGRGLAQLSHYRPDRYSGLTRSMYSPVRFRPRSPWDLFRRARRAGVRPTLASAVCIPLLPALLHAVSLRAFRRERKRLRALERAEPVRAGAHG